MLKTGLRVGNSSRMPGLIAEEHRIEMIRRDALSERMQRVAHRMPAARGGEWLSLGRRHFGGKLAWPRAHMVQPPGNAA
jgi:hypothetical protein